ncbi:MAG TPA: biotin synthase BioB [Caulobacterales bacterium]|nr:biotin synthase BioB [Caulobacterales bacterium]
MTSSTAPDVRHDWTRDEILAIASRPFADLIFDAQAALRAHFEPNAVQRSQLLSIKTGGCAENCGYCSQSAHFDTGLKAGKLMAADAVIEAAQAAKAGGAQRFCMGAAWRELKDRDVEAICTMIEGVKAAGLETCMTLGMLTAPQAERLAESGLDYYNHNLDTGPDYYSSVVSTRTYQDRLDTLALCREAGMRLCCGGIFGMGERPEDRADLLVELAKMRPHPESVPINRLVPIPGTPLADKAGISGLDFVRWIATARIVFPQSVVRIAAGREDMTEELQALCLLAGANSLFVGDRLLTTDNPGEDRDERLLEALGVAALA